MNKAKNILTLTIFIITLFITTIECCDDKTVFSDAHDCVVCCNAHCCNLILQKTKSSIFTTVTISTILIPYISIPEYLGICNIEQPPEVLLS